MLRKLFLLALFMSVAGSITAYSQTNSAQAQADAEMSLPISISPSPYGFRFGGFMPGASAGTVVLGAFPFNVTRTATGGVTLVTADGGEPGYIFVQGEPDAIFDLEFPSDPITVTLLWGSETMTLTNITLYPTDDPLTISEMGSLYVYFGGTLNVAANQTMGEYRGTFVITASYL